ncbi:MAG: DUF6531 domain-containing protein [Thermodesulfovibrionales bacterium]
MQKTPYYFSHIFLSVVFLAFTHPNPSYGGGGSGGGDGPTVRGTAGDPVDLATGYFIYRHTDYSLPGMIPVNVTRHYRSGDLVVVVPMPKGLSTSIYPLMQVP